MHVASDAAQLGETEDVAESAAPDELVLSGPITVATVEHTKQRLRQQLATTTACVIHAAEVTRLDAAGAQLLHAFLVEVARRGATARWASASLYLVEAARMLGMERYLGLSSLPAEVTSWQP